MKIVVIAHNIRSTHNVGSLLRTCDGLGIDKVYLTGYTPYPICDNDMRLPHLAKKIDSQIHKTALGAENTVSWQYTESPLDIIRDLKGDGYEVVALEQSDTSIMLNKYDKPEKVCLVLGEEVEGVPKDLLPQCDEIVEIPMYGKKESFNVSVAGAMALYHFRFC